MILFLISIFSIILLAVLLVIYRRLQQAKAETAKLLSLNNSVKQLQDKHSELLRRLSDAELIDSHCRQKLLAFSNNYFIFQPINEVNLSKYVELIDLLHASIEQELENPDYNADTFNQYLKQLSEKIPTEPRDFSSGYYTHFAPDLVRELAQALAKQTNLESLDSENNEVIEESVPQTSEDQNTTETP